MERPAYSTPPPVENTPANNECRMVELRGSKVASFQINNEQFICLPQVDIFITVFKQLAAHRVNTFFFFWTIFNGNLTSFWKEF